MTKLYLVRHAKAGERRLWEGNDIDRPLSKPGRKQAAALATRLAPLRPTVLLSSAYVRCVQTLEPLSAMLEIAVTIEGRLSEYEPFGPVIDLLAEVPGGAVLCSHGDVIPETVVALQRRGTEIRGPADWRKGSVWVLKRNKRGQIVQATVWPPPNV